MGAIIVATGFKLRSLGHPLLRLRQVPQRLHQPGGRAAAERGRADLGQTGAPRRLDAQGAWASSTAWAAATPTTTPIARASAACTLKLAHLVREKTKAEVYNCYIDMRTPGKGFEEFYNRVQNEGVQFIRGKVADITPAGAWAGSEGAGRPGDAGGRHAPGRDPQDPGGHGDPGRGLGAAGRRGRRPP